jgi:hypothetical protein
LRIGGGMASKEGGRGGWPARLGWFCKSPKERNKVSKLKQKQINNNN